MPITSEEERSCLVASRGVSKYFHKVETNRSLQSGRDKPGVKPRLEARLLKISNIIQGDLQDILSDH